MSLSPNPPETVSGREFYRWLIAPTGREMWNRLPEPVDLRTLVLERDRRGEPAARVQSLGRPGTFAFVLRLASTGPRRWEWLPAHADESLALSAALRESGRLLQWLTPLVDSIHHTRTVAHRPGRRIVVKVEGSRDGEPRTLYLKGLRRSAYRRAKTAADALLESPVARCLCLPTSFLDDVCTLVFRSAPGVALHDRGVHGSPVAVQAVERMLEILASEGGALANRFETRDVEAERRSALTQLERGSEFLPELKPLVDRIREMDLARPPGPDGLVHGDLHDKQILLDGDRARLLDLDTLAVGSSWIDRANLLEHVDLRLRQGLWTEAWAAPLRTRLLPAVDSPAIASLRAVVRARLAGVYAQRPYWWNLARELADSFDLRGAA